MRSLERLSVPEVPYARAVGLGAAAVGAAYIRKRQRDFVDASKELANPHPEVALYPGKRSEFAIKVHTGLFVDPFKYSKKVGPLLEDLGDVYSMRHGPNVEENLEADAEINKRIAGRRIISIAISKGGLDYLRLQATKPEPEYTELAIFESAVMKKEFVTKTGDRMARTGRRLENSYAMAKLFEWRNNQPAMREVRRTGPGAFPTAQVDAAVLMSDEPHFADSDIQRVMSEDYVGEVFALAAPDDAMVHTAKGAEWLAGVTGRTVDHVIDDRRDPGEHASFHRKPERLLYELKSRLYPES